MSPELFTNAELISVARDSLTESAWNRLMGAAESETTARRNRLALDCIALRPRVLVGVGDVETSTTILGRDIRMPVVLANIGDPAFIQPDGAAEIEDAAARFGTLAFVPPASTSAAASGPDSRILEVSAHDPPASVLELVDRAAELGCAAMCVSLVPSAAGRREREPRGAGATVRHLRDVWQVVAAVVGRGGLPIVAKGVTNGDDARAAIDRGCAAIYVSNYGGRALDHCEATIDVLAEVVDAVAGRAEVIIDGGFMRATDVVKALAGGADVVAVGRLQGLGLAAGGSQGLVRALEILEDELGVTMALLGATDIDQLGPGHVFPGAPPVQLPHDTSAFFRLP